MRRNRVHLLANGWWMVIWFTVTASMSCMMVVVMAAAATSSSSPTKDSLQANFGDKTFAGGMAWEPVQDLLYLTGQVGSNGCWVGIVQRTTMQFVSKVVLPEPAICQGLYVPGNQPEAYVLATTEEGGLFTNTRVTGSKKSTQYGLILPIQWQDGRGIEPPKLPKGLLLHDSEVQYPRSIVGDPDSPDTTTFYVASLHSESKALTDDFRSLTADAQTPNLTPSGVLKFGTQHYVRIERIRVNPLEEEHGLQAEWRKPFGLAPTSIMRTEYSVELGNMIYHQEKLFVAGSTRGGGELFGTPQETDLNVTMYKHPYVMNGFISKLNPATGAIAHPTTTGTNEVVVHRVSQGNDVDTWVEAICSSSNVAESIYVVGRYVDLKAEKGGTSVAFLARLDANTFDLIWQKDLVFTQNAFGVDCAAVADWGVNDNDVAVAAPSEVVYLAGIVENGGTYSNGSSSATVSFGKDDLFVVKAQGLDGHLDWVKQLGTQGNDRLAHGGSGILAVTGGGVVLFGDTSGDFLSTNHKGTEMFVVGIQSDGTIRWSTTETSGIENAGGSVQIQVPKRTDSAVQSDGGDGNGGRPLSPEDGKRTPILEQTGTGGGIGMILAIVVLALVLITGYIVRSHKQEKVTERALVFSYLHAFDLEDVEVRQSVTGGWHGTYVGQLAKGKGLGKDDSGSGHGSRLSHSSIVRDSLFVDYNEPRRRHEDEEEDKDSNENMEGSSNTFRIGSDDTSSSAGDDDDDDDDFEEIGRLEAQLASDATDENDGNNAWGRDII